MENRALSKKKYAFLKAYVRYRMNVDPNARQFIKNGTVLMKGRQYNQYYFFEPSKFIKTEELSNLIMLQSSSVDEVYIMPEKLGIHVKVSFIKDRKPCGFEKSLRDLGKQYGKLLTHSDCLTSPKDLQ